MNTTSALNSLAQSQRTTPHHALLLYGTRFSGSSEESALTTAEWTLLAQDLCKIPLGASHAPSTAVLGNHPDIELLIASDKNIKREEIAPFLTLSQYAPTYGIRRLLGIERCERLTSAAANALLKTLEAPAANVLFVLTCHHIQQVLPTVASRCLKWPCPRNEQRTPVREGLLASGWEAEELDWLEGVLTTAGRSLGPKNLHECCRQAEQISKKMSNKEIIAAATLLLKETWQAQRTAPTPAQGEQLRQTLEVLLEWNNAQELNPSGQLWLMRLALLNQ